MSTAPRNPLHLGVSVISTDSAQVTGSATYVDQLIRQFAMRPDEVDVEVLCNDHAYAALGPRAADSVRLLRARYFPVGSSRPRRLAAIAGARIAPGPLAAQFSPQLEVAHYPLNFMVPAVRVPAVVTVHDVQHRDLPQYFSSFQKRWRDHFYRLAARRATVIVTDSEHARGRIADEYGVDPERIISIHLAVEHDRFDPRLRPDEAEVRARLGLGERYLYYPASFWPHKRHEQLLEAFAGLDDPELALLLTGAPFGRLEALLGLAARLGLEGRVRHLGFVAADEVPVIYRGALATVFPSSYEGFGMPPLEAMACGCPVASSLATSLKEVCGEHAVALDPDDPPQMAGAIGRLIADGELRARLSREGPAWAARFTWERAADAHLAAYGRAASCASENGRIASGLSRSASRR